MSIDQDSPALLGGPPVRPEGPPAWPLPDEQVLAALQSAYDDGSWGRYHGVFCERLEAALRDYLGTEFVLPCASGTFAVELALRALKIGAGDEILLAAIDYPGNFLSIHAVGAHPVLVDVDPSNWNLAPVLSDAVSAQTRVIIVSHLHGGLVPMREVMAQARERGVAVIEDAAQAPGAVVQGKKAGTWGDIGVWSFGGSKLLTSGRGGAIFTNRPEAYQRARTWMQRGNQVCPLSELQAAVLLPQVARLDERNRYRALQVRRLEEQLRGLSGLRLLQNRAEECSPAYYKVGFQFDATQFGLSRRLFIAAVRAEGIAMDEGFAAAHVGRSPRRFRQAGSLAQAEQAHHGMIVLHHPVLLGTPEDIAQIVRAITKVHQNREKLQRLEA